MCNTFAFVIGIDPVWDGVLIVTIWYKIENYWMWTLIWRTKNMIYVRFKFMYLMMQVLMLLPAQHLLPFYWPPEESKPKIWMHMKRRLHV